MPISVLSIENNVNISHECINCTEYEYLKISKKIGEVLIYSKSLNQIILIIKRKNIVESLRENSIGEMDLIQKARPFLNEKTVRIPLK